MLLRLVVICVGIVLLYLLVRRSFARPTPQKRAREIGRMVRCAQCGLHLPQEEALADGADFFCSGEHRDAARR